MLRQTIVPTQNILSINLPNEMIGKKIEITLLELENNVSEKEYSLSDFAFNLVEEERAKIKKDTNYLLDWDIVKESLND